MEKVVKVLTAVAGVLTALGIVLEQANKYVESSSKCKCLDEEELTEIAVGEK